MLRNFNSRLDQYIQTNFVEVTSPEQFVPTYLAYMADNTPGSNSGYPNIYFPVNKPRYAKSELKKYLLDQLNLSYPDRYCFPIDKDQAQGRGSTSNLGTSDARLVFHGGYNRVGLYMYNAIVLPGTIVVVYGNNCYNSLGSAHYNNLAGRQGYYTIDYSNRMMPAIMTLVKAKHIPLIRAMQHLGMPGSIPVSDMRIITVDNPDYNTSTYIQAILGQSSFMQFMNTSGIVREYMKREDMLKFLVDTSNRKPILQVLEDAVEV